MEKPNGLWYDHSKSEFLQKSVKNASGIGVPGAF